MSKCLSRGVEFIQVTLGPLKLTDGLNDLYTKL